LPRSEELTGVLLLKDKGEVDESGEFARIIAKSVAEVVKLQVDAGIDIPSDGEQGKVGYSTYMMDRLNGFGGDTKRKIALDLVEYPKLRSRLALMIGVQQFRRASCIGPISVKDWTPLQNDIANLRAAIDAAGVDEPHARGIRMGDRGGHARRVSADSRCRIHSSTRLPRPCDGPPYRLPGSDRS
jgi:5-methyltetrahydropteroyltriglutamate--homocysteine methyltransferase